MLTGLYSAGTAMEAATRHHEVVAHNLAHAHMPGYRRQLVRHASFESALQEEMQGSVNRQAMGTSSSEVVTDFTIGSMSRTDHALDVALQGPGFFVVEGPQGPLYTRNGAFQLDATGQLVTIDGLPVQGSGGPITIPTDVPSNAIEIAQDGSISAAGSRLGKLQIVDFEEPQRLTKAGITLYAADGLAPQEVDTPLLQGMREGSNVSPVQELVELINAQRRQEAAQRSMTLLSESISKNIDL